jgi:hypothetical protein
VDGGQLRDAPLQGMFVDDLEDRADESVGERFRQLGVPLYTGTQQFLDPLGASVENVAMTLALVFAMSGGAYAAGKYLITSTKQISPKVLKGLKGKPGAAGSQGAQGIAGPAGAQGPEGKPGTVGKDGAPGIPGKDGAAGTPGKDGKDGSPWTAGGTLPSGKSLIGEWN